MSSISIRGDEIRYSDLHLKLSTREAVCGNQKTIVKATPFRLLVLLASNAGEVVSRKSMFEKVWGYDFDPGTKIIDVQLNYIRKVLVSLGCEVRIKTLRGRGLCLYGEG